MKLKLKSNKVSELLEVLKTNHIDINTAKLEYSIIEDAREPDEYWVDVYVKGKVKVIPPPPTPPKSRMLREGDEPPKPKNYER